MVTFNWITDLDAAITEGFVLGLFKEKSGGLSVAYCSLDPVRKIWINGYDSRPLSEPPIAWVSDTALIPKPDKNSKHKEVTFDWNFDMEAGKDAGIVLVAGTNDDGSHGIGYGYWDSADNAWCSGYTQEPTPAFTPEAWIKDSVLSPYN